MLQKISIKKKWILPLTKKKKWILAHKSQKHHDPTAVTNRTSRGPQASQMLMWRDMVGVLDVFWNDSKAPNLPNVPSLNLQYPIPQ